MLQIVNMGCIPVGFIVAYLIETRGLSVTVRPKSFFRLFRKQLRPLRGRFPFPSHQNMNSFIG